MKKTNDKTRQKIPIANKQKRRKIYFGKLQLKKKKTRRIFQELPRKDT